MSADKGRHRDMQVGCKHEHKERKKKKLRSRQAWVVTGRGAASQVSGHIKEKKSEHHVTCRQTCHGTAGMHVRELQRHAWRPNDGVRWTSGG